MATRNDMTHETARLNDVIQTKARQLRALLDNTWGEPGDSFRIMPPERQDEYLWACSDMAEEIVKSLDKLTAIELGKVPA